MSRRVALTILAALTALVAHLTVAFAPRAAHGAAGDRKVFAAGAGSRALALGGAYVAAAEDATAIVWNPAALLALPAKEATFYKTTLPGEGLSYGFFGYAHPTLRFGTLGFGALRFNAEGIEGRDDRNFVTDASIEDSQMRWVFAYANRLTPAAAFGVGLKLDTHSLAGSSATALGADLGLTYGAERLGAEGALAASRFRFGLRLENALEPREKLGAATAADPRTIHAGVAYRLPVGNAVRGALTGTPTGALATAEWVREAGGESHVLLGAEVSAAGASLRAGRSAESWTAGAGFAAGGLAFDYAFAPSELAASHRVSARLAFGRTVDEMHAEAKTRDEAELAARLEHEMSARETERVTALVDSGRAALATGRYDDARQSFEGALLFVPADAAVEALLRDADARGLAAAARARIAAGDTAEALVAYRRALEANPDDAALVGELAALDAGREATRAADAIARAKEKAGIDALAEGRYPDALAQFATLVSIDPQNEDARRFRDLAVAGLKKAVDLLASQGSLLLERGLPDRAIAKWREALALAPDDKDLKDRIAAAETRERRRSGGEDLASAPAASAPREPLSPEEAAELASLYEKGVAEFKQGRIAEAVDYWEIVWRRDRSYGEVKGSLTKGYLIEGMGHYTAGRLPEAIETWRRALEVEPEDQKALAYVERATSELAKTREITRR